MDKILFSSKRFDVINRETYIGIDPYDLNVVVMPFERDFSGKLLNRVGVVNEFNPLRRGKYSLTLVTGCAEGEDPDILSTAMRELKEESGYDVQDPERWFYLGMMTTSKILTNEHPCFACDVTGIEKQKKEGDGTEGEKKSEFKMVTVKEALDTDDCFIPTVFMKMFRFCFDKPDDQIMEVDPLKKADLLKKRLDIKYLNFDGVLGSSIFKRGDTDDGEPYIKYFAKELTQDIQSIPQEMDGIRIEIEITNEFVPQQEINNGK